MVDAAAIRAAIEQVEEPELHRTLGELNMARDVSVARGGSVEVLIATANPDRVHQDRISADVEAAIRSIAGVGKVRVGFSLMSDDERVALMAELRGGPGHEIRVGSAGSSTRIIAIASGKGGVGKSSVTANLAVGLTRLGRTVGIIDADVWGFSIPKMLGIDRNPTVIDETLIPPEVHGVRVMSMDFFVSPDQAVIWRGPMLHKAMEQFLMDVHWDDPRLSPRRYGLPAQEISPSPSHSSFPTRKRSS